MSLPRKDIRFKVDFDMHTAIAVIAARDGMQMAEFVEAEVIRAVRRRVHDATVIASQTAHLKISGIGGESSPRESDDSDISLSSE